MKFNKPNIYEGTKVLIESINMQNELNSRKDTACLQNPLFEFRSPTVSSIESRELDTSPAYNRRLMNSRTVNMSVLKHKFTVKAETYSNYKKVSAIVLPYLLLLFLIVVLFSVFQIDVFLGSQTEKK